MTGVTLPSLRPHVDPPSAEPKGMDVALINTMSSTPSAAASSVRSTVSSSGFDLAMAASASQEAATVERAEAMIGTRIRAPEGGCSCDAFVSAAADPSARSLATAAASATSPPVQAQTRASESGLIQFPQPQMMGTVIDTRIGLEPGSVITIRNEDQTDTHDHRAILRNATEMITANADGVVEVLAVPWARLSVR